LGEAAGQHFWRILQERNGKPARAK
jgi:hypothetical protein